METGRTKDGRYVVKGTADTTWTEVPKDVYDAARSGPLEGFARGVKEGTQDLAAGGAKLVAGGLNVGGAEGPTFNLMNLLPGGSLIDTASRMMQGDSNAPVANYADAVARENDQRQAALAGAQPVMSTIGELVPEIVGGAGARTVRGAMALDAAIGAARNPDNPLFGGAVGAGTGLAANVGLKAVARSAGTLKGLAMSKSIKEGSGLPGRFSDAISPVYERAKNIPRTLGLRDSDAMRTGRSINATGTPNALGYDFAGAVERGLPMTEGDYLIATAKKGDRDALEAGDALRKQEEISRSGLSPQGNTVNRIRGAQEQWLTDRLANEVGDSSLDRLTIDNIHPVRERIGEGFDEVLKRYDDDFEVSLTQSDVEQLKAAFDDVPEAAETPSFRKARDKVLEASDGGAISGKDFNVVRNTLNDTRDRLISKGSTYDAGLSLDEAENILLSRFRSQLEPEERALFDQLNGQWKIIKVLEGAARSTDAGGVANASTIRNTYRRLNPLAAKGYDDNAIWNDIKIADYMLNKANVPNSGTADRLLGNAAKTGLAAGAAATGINLLGGN